MKSLTLLTAAAIAVSAATPAFATSGCDARMKSAETQYRLTADPSNGYLARTYLDRADRSNKLGDASTCLKWVAKAEMKLTEKPGK